MKVKLHLSYQQGMVVQACNPSSQRQENGEFKVSLGYVVNSRLAWTTEPLSQKTNNKLHRTVHRKELLLWYGHLQFLKMKKIQITFLTLV
jgi:hypothetical protein